MPSAALAIQPLPSGGFPTEKLAAASIVIAVIASIQIGRWWATRRQHARAAASSPPSDSRSGEAPRGGLITGYDRRISTSKTIAVAWTLLVAWMVITVALIDALQSQPSARFSQTLSHVSSLYLIYLGGPYAAALAAKATVTTKVTNGTLQKTDGEGLNPLDIISGDGGTTDLYDFQYTLFNLVALVIAFALFNGHPAEGMPSLPSFLATLTGGGAAAYALNKATLTNAPQITNIVPSIVRIGDVVTAIGVNLTAPAASSATTTITVGGVLARIQGAPQTNQIRFKVPPPTATAWASDPQDVVIITVANATAVAPAALTIVNDQPQVTGVDKLPLQAHVPFTITGRYFHPAGSGGTDPPAVTAETIWGDKADCPALGSPPSGDQIIVTLPTSITQGRPADYQVNLTLTRSDGIGSIPVAFPAKGSPAS
jgi:hypothetical protein